MTSTDTPHPQRRHLLSRDPKPGSRDHGGLHGLMREGTRLALIIAQQFREDETVERVEGKGAGARSCRKKQGLDLLNETTCQWVTE